MKGIVWKTACEISFNFIGKLFILNVFRTSQIGFESTGQKINSRKHKVFEAV